VDSFLEFLERPAPAGCEAVRDLCDWSLNCEHPTPWAVFLDLTGLWAELFGGTLCESMEEAAAGLGYVELSKIAAALEEYATRPQAVEAYARDLLEAEGDR